MLVPVTISTLVSELRDSIHFRYISLLAGVTVLWDYCVVCSWTTHLTLILQHFPLAIGQPDKLIRRGGEGGGVGSHV